MGRRDDLVNEEEGLRTSRTMDVEAHDCHGFDVGYEGYVDVMVVIGFLMHVCIAGVKVWDRR